MNHSHYPVPASGDPGEDDDSQATSKPEVLRALVDNHRRLLTFLENRLGDRTTAEDVLQSAFVRGVERAPEGPDAESAVHWFFRVLRNAPVDHHRRLLPSHIVGFTSGPLSSSRSPASTPRGLAGMAESLQKDGDTAMLVAVDGVATAALAVSDAIKPSTSDALRLLRESGVRVVMFTGDSRLTAEAVARRLTIDTVHAEVLPQDEHRIVRELQSHGRVVAMAGDGINDTPALAQADVGIAMGHGTDIAMQSARVVLVKGDLRGIVKARALSTATMRNIRRNLFFAFAYNALGVPLATGVLYPWFGILLSPMIASAAMSLSSVSVIGNALRLRRVEL